MTEEYTNIMNKPELVVLAAGIGSRYGGLKQIEPVGPDGEIIIDYSIYDAIRAGFNRVVFVIRRDIADIFRETIGQRFESRIDVAYAFQEQDDLPEGLRLPPGRTKPWGTGHAVLAARHAVRGPFAVINADDFYGQDSYRIVASALSGLTAPVPAVPRYVLVGFPLRNTLSDFGHVSRGICTCGARHQLCRIEELTHIEREGLSAIHRDPASGHTVRLTGDELVSMNMWGFTPDLFARLQRLFCDFLADRAGDLKAEFYLPAAVDRMIQAKETECLVQTTVSTWAGVTYREDRALLQAFIVKLIEQGCYPSPLWR